MKRIGVRFEWIEPRRRALAYLCGLLALLFPGTVYETRLTPELLPLSVPELPRLLWRLVWACASRGAAGEYPRPRRTRHSPLHRILYRHHGGQNARRSANQAGEAGPLMLQGIAQNVARLFFHAATVPSRAAFRPRGSRPVLQLIFLLHTELLPAPHVPVGYRDRMTGAPRPMS
jgi:hypothetical protein